MSNPKNSFSDNPNLKKLSGKQQELGELAASADGQKIRQLLGDEQVIKYAVENGDTSTLQGILKDILRTDEGKRLAAKLNDLLNK